MLDSHGGELEASQYGANMDLYEALVAESIRYALDEGSDDKV